MLFVQIKQKMKNKKNEAKRKLTKPLTTPPKNEWAHKEMENKRRKILYRIAKSNCKLSVSLAASRSAGWGAVVSRYLKLK